MKRSRVGRVESTKQPNSPVIENEISEPVEDVRADILKLEDFSAHMSKYIGQTVTIFVNSGGLSGMGFTGVLLKVTGIYVKLIIKTAPVPACSLGNYCFSGPFFYFGSSCRGLNRGFVNRGVQNSGAMAYIRVSMIASFVHNSI